IHDPDDAVLAAVLAKSFADRGLRVASDVAAFIVARIDRSFVAISEIVAVLDALALASGREITVPLAREVLEMQGDWLEPAPAVIDLSPGLV
ncbi:MAG: HdaA/DnaA family protein, partial [Janthinobacterium lividum]